MKKINLILAYLFYVQYIYIMKINLVIIKSKLISLEYLLR